MEQAISSIGFQAKKIHSFKNEYGLSQIRIYNQIQRKHYSRSKETLIGVQLVLKKEYGESMTPTPIKLVGKIIVEIQFANDQDGEAYSPFVSESTMARIPRCKVITIQS